MPDMQGPIRAGRITPAAGLSLFVVAIFCGPLHAEKAKTPSTTSLPDPNAVEVGVKAPSTVAEIEQRRAKLADMLEQLQPATQPTATQPIPAASQPADVATNLWFSLKRYDELLATLKGEHEGLQKLKSEEGARELKEQIEKYKNETQRLTRLMATGKAGEHVDKLEDVSELYAKLNAENNTEFEAQTARVKRLGEFAELREKANERIAEARKEHLKIVADIKDRTTTMKAGQEESRLAGLQRLLADLRLEIALAELEALNLEEERLNLRQQRQERRLKALQPYVKKLREWMNALEEAKAEDRANWIKWNIENAKREYEKIYWQAAKVIHETDEKFEEYDNPTRDRFPESELGRLENMIQRQEQYWENFLESLPRRSGQEVLKRYQEVRKKLGRAEKRQDELRGELNLSIDEREALYLLRDQRAEEIDDLSEALSEAVAKTDAEGASEYLSKLTKDRLELTKQMDEIASLQNGLIERLRKGVEENEDYIEMLRQTRSRLYWAYLVVPDRGLMRLDTQALRKEWRDGGTKLRETVHAVRQEILEQLGQATGGKWVSATVVLTLSILLAGFFRVRLQGAEARLEERIVQRTREQGLNAVGMSDRLEISAARLGAEVSLWVLPLLGALWGLSLLGLTGRAWGLARLLFGFVIGIRLAFALVRAMFLRARPRFRLINCSNKVAAYYRRWCHALIWVTILFAPLPLVMYALDEQLLPETRTYLWQIFKAGSLVVVLLFLLRRQPVLKVIGRLDTLRTRWLYSVLGGIYPLIVLGVLGLLALEVLGYGALTSYLLTNLLLTMVILIGVSTLRRVISDILRKSKQRLDQEYQSQEQGADAESPEPVSQSPEVVAGEELGRGEWEFMLGFGNFLFKWVLRVVGLLLILRVWGITLVEINTAMNYTIAGSGERAITLWRVFAALLALVATVVISRFARSVLTTRVYPAYEALDLGARAALNTVLHYILIVLGVYVAMQFVFIDLSALTVVLGTLGLGLGLGLQPLFINFISGLMIFGERHIKVGDIVEVGDKIGEVTEISMRGTKIRTFDNIHVVIPNGDFITSQVVNWSLQDRRIRGQLDIGVAYGSDVKLVYDLLLKIADEHPLVMKDPAPIVWFTEFGDNALTFRLLVHFEDIYHRMSSLTEIRFEIDRIFAEHGINIPFPQRTISMIHDKPLQVELIQHPPIPPGGGGPETGEQTSGGEPAEDDGASNAKDTGAGAESTDENEGDRDRPTGLGGSMIDLAGDQ